MKDALFTELDLNQNHSFSYNTKLHKDYYYNKIDYFFLLKEH